MRPAGHRGRRPRSDGTPRGRGGESSEVVLAERAGALADREHVGKDQRVGRVGLEDADGPRLAARIEVPGKELLEPERIAKSEDVVEEPGLRKSGERGVCGQTGQFAERFRRGAGDGGRQAEVPGRRRDRRPWQPAVEITHRCEAKREEHRERRGREAGQQTSERGGRAVDGAEESGGGDDDGQRQEEGVVGSDVARGEKHARAEHGRRPEDGVGYS